MDGDSAASCIHRGACFWNDPGPEFTEKTLSPRGLADQALQWHVEVLPPSAAAVPCSRSPGGQPFAVRTL